MLYLYEFVELPDPDVLVVGRDRLEELPHLFGIANVLVQR